MKCEATTNPSYWWIPNKIDFPQCSKGASVNIDGINLCRQHAGQIALQKLVNSGEVKQIKGYTCNYMDRFSDRIY